MSEQAQLIDLPEETQRPKVKIITPKLVILSLLALYFISKNMYYYITRPQQTQQAPKVEIDTTKQFWEMFERFQNYVIVSIIGFALFFYMRKVNDKHEEEEYLKMKQKEEEAEEQERQKIREREERIIRKLQEEEREAEERQLRMAASNLSNSQQKQKNSEQSKQKNE